MNNIKETYVIIMAGWWLKSTTIMIVQESIAVVLNVIKSSVEGSKLATAV